MNDIHFNIRGIAAKHKRNKSCSGKGSFAPLPFTHPMDLIGVILTDRYYRYTILDMTDISLAAFALRCNRVDATEQPLITRHVSVRGTY